MGGVLVWFRTKPFATYSGKGIVMKCEEVFMQQVKSRAWRGGLVLAYCL